jgi:hypothetical protein
MDVTISQSSCMEALVNNLRQSFPSLQFTAGPTFYWSPETNEVFYTSKSKEPKHIWSLLHETGHAVLEHTSYKADIELLQLEIAAWEKAKELAASVGIKIDESHIQDCLDTYRDWLYSRSICPTCTTKCLQQSDMAHYRCFNCHTVWGVTPSRFCRAYRSTKNIKKPSLVFHAMDGF